MYKKIYLIIFFIFITTSVTFSANDLILSNYSDYPYQIQAPLFNGSDTIDIVLSKQPFTTSGSTYRLNGHVIIIRNGQIWFSGNLTNSNHQHGSIINTTFDLYTHSGDLFFQIPPLPHWAEEMKGETLYHHLRIILPTILGTIILLIGFRLAYKMLCRTLSQA